MISKKSRQLDSYSGLIDEFLDFQFFTSFWKNAIFRAAMTHIYKAVYSKNAKFNCIFALGLLNLYVKDFQQLLWFIVKADAQKAWQYWNYNLFENK